MRSKRILIPVLLLSVLAAAALLATVWMGLCADPSAGLAGARFTGPDAYLSLFSGENLNAVIQSAVLRLLTIAVGGLAGYLAGAAASRIHSAYGRAVMCAIFLLPAFIPSTVWGALMLPIAENTRRILAGSIPVFSLTAAAGMLFEIRRKKSFGMLAVILLSLAAFFSTDAPLDLGAHSAAVTLHTLIAGNTSTAGYAAAGFKMTVECLLSIIVVIVLIRLVPRPEETEAFQPSRDAGCGGAFGAAFGTLFLICCIALIPLMINLFSGTITLSSIPANVLSGSALCASAAMLLSFGLTFGFLALSAGGARAARGFLLWAVPLLLALTPVKYALVTRFFPGTIVPAVASAILNPVSAFIAILFLLLDAKNIRVHLLAAGSAALAGAACAAGSAYPFLVYGIPGLGGLLDASPDHSVYTYLLPALLLTGCIGAALFSCAFAFTDRTRAWHQPVRPRQGLTRKGNEMQEPQEAEARAWFKNNEPVDTRPTVNVATLENKAPVKMTSDESISAHSVPAATSYTTQFLKAEKTDNGEPPVLSRTLPMNDPEPPVLSRTLPMNDPEPPVNLWSAPPADPETSAQAASPLFNPPSASSAEPEPEFDPTAPSAAQIVSMINALTRMRSLGIVSDREYREKKDALMKLI